MSRLWLIGTAVFVTALIVAGLIVALVTSRGEDLLPADSPEGAVQRYLQALEDNDYVEAHDYLAEEVAGRCSVEEFVQSASRYGDVRDSQMTLEGTQRLDGTAIVTARVTVFEPDVPFPPSEYSYTRTYEVSLENGEWKLVWPDYFCPPLY